jgi:2-polyprenyl-3-methyl-5-hydroxy-6-metoxy-1,4-benzoquinol methylase
MPYFGHIWPSAEALVAYLLAGPRLDGVRALDLGCGVGACGFAAAHQGADVTFFDWEPRALEIVASTAGRQTCSPDQLHFAVGDWRDPPELGHFDLILGADLLYEARNAQPVARFIASHLRPDGQALIADPGRLHAEPFPTLAAAAGLRVIGGSLGAETDTRFNFWTLQCP